MTRRPQTTRPINPPAPRAAPACIRQGTGMTEQRHATLPIRHSRPKPSGTAAGIHLLCRCHGSSSLSPTKTFEGRHPGVLVSPLQNIICSGRCLVVHMTDTGGRHFVSALEVRTEIDLRGLPHPPMNRSYFPPPHGVWNCARTERSMGRVPKQNQRYKPEPHISR